VADLQGKVKERQAYITNSSHAQNKKRRNTRPAASLLPTTFY
jgi:hypothetical protein